MVVVLLLEIGRCTVEIGKDAIGLEFNGVVEVAKGAIMVTLRQVCIAAIVVDEVITEFSEKGEPQDAAITPLKGAKLTAIRTNGFRRISGTDDQFKCLTEVIDRPVIVVPLKID